MPLLNREEASDDGPKGLVFTGACECGKWFNSVKVTSDSVECKTCGVTKNV